jgi:energy-coupling factor transporter ATP-binding protein EcfA2
MSSDKELGNVEFTIMPEKSFEKLQAGIIEIMGEGVIGEMDREVSSSILKRKKKEELEGPLQWSKRGMLYFPTGETVNIVPAGYYSVEKTDMGLALQRRKVITDKLIQLPSEEYTEILKDISEFWEKRADFALFEFIFKRGILLYGPAGTGKTSLLNILANYIIEEKEGIVIRLDHPRLYAEFMKDFRSVEPLRPVIILIEDIDELIRQYDLKTVLNVLDGNEQIDGVLYLATTNYPERLEERIRDRPSRFDRRYCIGTPNEEARRYYLKNRIPLTKQEGIDIDKWAKDTDEFSVSHLKELIISVLVLKNDYSDALIQLKGLKKIVSAKGETKSPGFIQSKVIDLEEDEDDEDEDAKKDISESQLYSKKRKDFSSSYITIPLSLDEENDDNF